MVDKDFSTKTRALIDDLKSTCKSYGLGNTGNEYVIITQVFLYKFLNDKFVHEVKRIDSRLAKAKDWEQEVAKYSEKDYAKLLQRLRPDCARLQRDQFLTYLFNHQNEDEFHKLFDTTLREISVANAEVFSVMGSTGDKIKLFDDLSQFVSPAEQDDFCKAIVNKLVPFSFEGVFSEGYDFFSSIFEYLIKDYNTDGGGVYAEYYTPRAIAKIMAAILVDGPVKNVTCYDPSAGTGQLLMSLAHAIGEDNCSVYAEDISLKSSGLLRLNLVLNGLVHSLHNVIKGNTIRDPYKRADWPESFDYIVSNPPFKLDFSEYREDLVDNKANKDRFYAGIPKVPAKKKKSMAIYLLFIQHIIHALGPKGKAAIVVPTGFVTAQSGIELKIRQKLVDGKMLRGVVGMPSNIFASTGTNVSVLFLDKANTKGDIVLMDASKLGDEVKEGDNKKTLLQPEEEQSIINTFRTREAVEDFSVVLSYDDIKAKNYSFSAGQYFDVKIQYVDITAQEFADRMGTFSARLEEMFDESRQMETEIQTSLRAVKHA